ncbi:MAG: N-acetylneuraminate synthase family protein [Armatimonadota bacterium]|nr:N-acetylneuraminate synthase family protein [Armatimonadota bacterium]
MGREITIGGRRITDDEPCYVIAEIGHNHGGSVETCRRMFDKAIGAGVDAVKLQKRDNTTLYSRELLAKPYDNENSYGATYGEHRAALEFGAAEYAAVHPGLWGFIATAFDEPSADFLAAAYVDAIKIASGGLTDLPLLRHVARLRIPVILSTGGGTMPDIDAAVNEITAVHEDLAILHCTAAYPVRDFSELNLRVITTLRQRFPYVIGWSGHDSGIAMALVAYTLGARIIEKHFTLNRAMKGTDHAFSLEPQGMAKLCRDLKRAHDALGDGVKRYYESERAPIAKMRRRVTPEGLRITGEMDVID